jgi:DNA-directed RNA polymerase specialized sigma subunit
MGTWYGREEFKKEFEEITKIDGEDESIRRIDAAMIASRIMGIIGTLKGLDRKIATFRFVNGMKVSDIAKMTGLSKYQISVKIANITKIVKKEVQSE